MSESCNIQAFLEIWSTLSPRTRKRIKAKAQWEHMTLSAVMREWWPKLWNRVRALSLRMESEKKKPEKIWLLTMESEHFTWLSTGRTKTEAKNAFIKRWDESHPGTLSKDFKARFGENILDYYGAWIRLVKIGAGYCDTD